jgi:hypothetical protein
VVYFPVLAAIAVAAAYAATETRENIGLRTASDFVGR